MLEALIVFGVVTALVALGVLVAVLPLPILVAVGAASMALGLAVGVPAGAYYHLKLYRYLADNGGVPRGFFWHPTRYHDSVPTAAFRSIWPWFVAGAVGFVLILLGCAIVMLGVLRA